MAAAGPMAGSKVAGWRDVDVAGMILAYCRRSVGRRGAENPFTGSNDRPRLAGSNRGCWTPGAAAGYHTWPDAVARVNGRRLLVQLRKGVFRCCLAARR